MTLSGLLAALGAERSFANLRTQAGLPPGERSAETVISAPDGMRAVLTAQLRGALDDAPAPAGSRAPVLLAVTATGRESEDLAAALGAYLRYPGADLLSVLRVEAAAAGAWVVGEDMGTVEDSVREFLGDLAEQLRESDRDDATEVTTRPARTACGRSCRSILGGTSARLRSPPRSGAPGRRAGACVSSPAGQ